MKRYAMVIGIKPDRIEEYRELHDNIWPEVVEVLGEAHVKNYSIFLHDNKLFGYMEYHGNDYATDMQRVADAPVTQKWWGHTEPLQEQLPDHQPGQWWTMIEEVFHMD
jgi:L-rhamnose mutarotase